MNKEHEYIFNYNSNLLGAHRSLKVRENLQRQPVLFNTLHFVRTASERCHATYGEQFKEIKIKIYSLYVFCTEKS